MSQPETETLPGQKCSLCGATQEHRDGVWVCPDCPRDAAIQRLGRIPVPDELPEGVVHTLKLLDEYRAGALKAARAVAVCEVAVERFPDLGLRADTYGYDNAELVGKARSLRDLVGLFRFLKHQGWKHSGKHRDDLTSKHRHWRMVAKETETDQRPDVDICLAIRFGDIEGAVCQYEKVGTETVDVTELVCRDKDGKRIEKPTSLEVPDE